jgi:hypothetical protein
MSTPMRRTLSLFWACVINDYAAADRGYQVLVPGMFPHVRGLPSNTMSRECGQGDHGARAQTVRLPLNTLREGRRADSAVKGQLWTPAPQRTETLSDHLVGAAE